VTWSERLQRLASRGAEFATTRRVRVGSQILLLVALVFVLLRLRSVWRDSHASLETVSWLALAGAAALATVAVVEAAFVWLEILRGLGASPRRHWAAIFLQAQLGKYVPGSVWQYAGRAALARVEAAPLRVVAASMTAEVAAGVLAGGVIASLLVGLWAFVAVLAVASGTCVVGARLFLRRPRIRDFIERRAGGRAFARTLRATIRGAALYLLIWGPVGFGFWMTARALFGVPLSAVGYYAGAFAVASLAGLFAFFAPVGLGVREAVIVALLRPRLGTADAVLLAGVSRGILTVVDIVTAAAGAVILKWTRVHARVDASVTVERP
jgi:glycosyltransferase 2 family protein